MDGQYFLRKYDNNCSIMTQKYAFFHRFRSDFTKVNRLYLILRGREGSNINIGIIVYLFHKGGVLLFTPNIQKRHIYKRYKLESGQHVVMHQTRILRVSLAV